MDTAVKEAMSSKDCVSLKTQCQSSMDQETGRSEEHALSAGVIRLPRDVSSSFFIYHLRESHGLQIALSLDGVFAAFLLIKYDALNNWKVSMWVLILLVISFLIICELDVCCYYGVVHKESKIKLLEEVVKQRPGLDPVVWDLIAFNVNQFMYEKHLFPWASYFFDGRGSRGYFEKAFVKRIARLNAENRRALRSADELMTCDQAFYFDDLVGIGSITVEAVEVYITSIKDRWMLATDVSFPDANPRNSCV
ncbi:LAFE_0A02344g1_1 [Lachancea fermentati]|uniref:LAFE_0A02344g1_1 n=1 Tax=Lachancea fermentati TaxID=4955 RepID=A0A1G4M6G4_LACFM|nr:LAFE_0A02344g1_1 [Lachancea fermentati]